MTGDPITVLGAGAWGTALACAFARTGAPVRLWGRDAAAVVAMTARRENVSRLPGVVLAPAIVPEPDLDAAVTGAAIVVAAVPTQSLRDLARALAPHTSRAPLVLCAKGIERDTGQFPTEIVAGQLPGRTVAVLSGPSFAADVGRGLPTAVTLAADDPAQAAALAARLGSSSLRIYYSDDVRGVEIGGAAKNVLAIACGIAAGRGLGPSAVAALTARAFAELSRFGRAFGARPETLAGLSGLGDLVLTCGSAQSRNYAHGYALGRGEPATGRAVVEGVWTAPILVRLGRERQVDLPISGAVAAVLDNSLGVDEAIDQLMRRSPKAEG